MSAGRPGRGWRVAAIVIACGWLADRHALPALAGHSVRDALASGGYPGARFEVGHVGLDRVHLRDVHLADGVDLGEVELDVGISALWGDRPARATVRGARIALDAMTPDFGGRRAAQGSSIRRVRIEDAALTRGGDRATIRGDISLAGPLAADLRATGVRIGGGAAVDAALRVREAGRGRYDAAWELRGGSWTARGEGALALGAGGAALVHSRTEVRAGELRSGAVSLEGVRARIDLAGPLAALEARGDARADRAEIAGRTARVTLRDVRVPIAVHARRVDGALAVVGRPVVARAAEGTIAAAGRRLRASEVEVEIAGDAGGEGEGGEDARPLVTLGGSGAAWPGRVAWRAAGLSAGALRAEQLAGSYDLATATHAIAWRALAARSVELGRGELAVRLTGDAVRLERARIEAAGGELVAGPAELGPAPGELAIRARGLQLGRLVPRRKVEATALLDGEVLLRLDGAGVTFVRGELHARGRGAIRLRDPALRRRAGELADLEQRLVGTLADFEHTALAAVLGPPGSQPELRVIARGRGARVPQELDLTLNFRGVWTTLDRLARSSR
jgi:hypothetical protein